MLPRTAAMKVNKKAMLCKLRCTIDQTPDERRESLACNYGVLLPMQSCPTFNTAILCCLMGWLHLLNFSWIIRRNSDFHRVWLLHFRDSTKRPSIQRSRYEFRRISVHFQSEMGKFCWGNESIGHLTIALHIVCTMGKLLSLQPFLNNLATLKDKGKVICATPLLSYRTTPHSYER